MKAWIGRLAVIIGVAVLTAAIVPIVAVLILSVLTPCAVLLVAGATARVHQAKVQRDLARMLWRDAEWVISVKYERLLVTALRSDAEQLVGTLR